MRERELEAYLFAQVTQRGGICIKLTPTNAGVPDRIVLCPNGTAHLLELKTLTGRVEPVQREWHRRSALKGWPVEVVRGEAGIDAWLDEHMA